MQSSRARAEHLWEDYFRKPSHWLDNRKSKRNPKDADFRKKLSHECLWIDSWYTPVWVKRNILSEGMIQREGKEEEEEREDEEGKGKGNIKRGSSKSGEELWRNVSIEDALCALEKGSKKLPQPSYDDLAFILKKCKRNRENALRVYAYMERKGLKSHKMLGHMLVSLLVDAGCISQAHHVIDCSMHPNEAPLHAIMHGYVKHNMHDHALIMYERMKTVHYMHQCICPRMFVALLKSCAELKDLERGRELHCKIEEFGLLEVNAFIGSSLIYMYSSCGCLAEARKVLDTSWTQDAVMWTSLIGGYCMYGSYGKAMDCFEQMQYKGFSPNAVTFISVLKACAHIGAVDKIKEIVTEIESRGWLGKEFVLGCALVDTYARCGFFATAWEASDKISNEKNIVTWNALMSGLSDHGLGGEALKCLEQMQCEGIVGNSVTFVCGMKACGSIRARDKGKAIHAWIDSLGLSGRKDIIVGNALIGMYSKCGLLEFAQAVFDKLQARDVVSWTALIDGYTEYGQGASAIKCYEQMRLENVTPNSITFVCGLKACGSIGITDKGIKIHSEIERKGCLPETNIVLGNALLDMYTKAGLLSSAEKLFGKLPHRDSVSWNILIDGYVHRGEIENVFRSFHSMQTEGMHPDYVTFIILLKACSRARLRIKSQTYFEIMSQDYGILPTIKHYTCVVDLLGREGRLDKALEMIRKGPLFPNLVTWRTMLDACRYWGNLELGKYVFDYAKQSGPLKPL